MEEIVYDEDGNPQDHQLRRLPGDLGRRAADRSSWCTWRRRRGSTSSAPRASASRARSAPSPASTTRSSTPCRHLGVRHMQMPCTPENGLASDPVAQAVSGEAADHVGGVVGGFLDEVDLGHAAGQTSRIETCDLLTGQRRPDAEVRCPPPNPSGRGRRRPTSELVAVGRSGARRARTLPNSIGPRMLTDLDRLSADLKTELQHPTVNMNSCSGEWPRRIIAARPLRDRRRRRLAP